MGNEYFIRDDFETTRVEIERESYDVFGGNVQGKEMLDIEHS